MKQIAGLSPVLFHITGKSRVVNIINKNRFELKPSDGTDVEENLGLSYYLSTARLMGSSYIKRGMGIRSAVIELDGTKLSQRFTGKAVDYWGPSMYTEVSPRSDRFESEDRLFSKTPTIPALPYIKAVYAMTTDKYADANTVDTFGRELWAACLKNKIPLYWFNNEQDLYARNLSKALKHRPVDPGDAGQRKWVPSPEYQALLFKNPKRKDTGLGALIALYEIPAGERREEAVKHFTPRIKREYDNLWYGGRDEIQRINSEMHNAKGIDYGDASHDRENLDKLVSIFRKHKWKPEDFLEHLRMKWQPLRWEQKVNETCPKCGGPAVTTEKRAGGSSVCSNGHKFVRPSMQEKTTARLQEVAMTERPYTGTSGVYTFCMLSEQGCKALEEWCEANGVFKDWTYTNKGDEHVTVMYSPVETPKQWIKQTQTHVARGLEFALFGPESNTLVIKLFSPTLHERHEMWKAAGAMPTYPSYNPHVTVSFKQPVPVNAAVLIATWNRQLKLKPLFLELTPEQVYDCKP